MHCNTCNIRIPPNRPILFCSVCKQNKHYKCNNLSKRRAAEILANNTRWACNSCSHSNSPDSVIEHNYSLNSPHTAAAVLCTVCLNTCPSSDQQDCCWCNKPCHTKCLRNSLGCLSCCNAMIPGYNYETHQIIGSQFNNHTPATYTHFNPEDAANHIGNSFEVEEEAQLWTEHYGNLNRCKYTKPHSFLQKSDELTVMSLNVRSLSKHIDTIRTNITHYNSYDILCFSETNCNPGLLPNGMDDILLEGYYPPFIRSPHRASNRGGGLAIYVNHRVCDELDATLLELETPLASSQDPACEFLFVKVNIKLANSPNKKSYIFGNFYRSPSSPLPAFFEKFEHMLEKLDQFKNKNTTLVGDFNIDLAKFDNCSHSQNLIDITNKFGFAQIINRPTRVTDHSATLIDHIYTNQVHNLVSSSVITYDLSDHLGTSIKIGLNSHIGAEKITKNFMQLPKINTENKQKFHELLTAEIWSVSHNERSTQAKYDKFIDTYQQHYEKAFPSPSAASRRKNERKNPKPWMLPWLEDACSRKNNAYKTFVLKPTTENKMKYEKLKNFTDKHIILAKNKFYADYFEKYSADSRKQWQMLNSLLNRKRNTKSSSIKLHQDNGNKITNPKDVAEKFNQYFATIAEKLKENINTENHSGTSFKSNLPTPIVNSMYITPTDPIEVRLTIMSFKLKSTSDTNIGAMQEAATVPGFTQMISEIVNSSFEQGVFPSQLKLAKVVPIHKGGSKTDVSNYRPISLLSAFSKIFEKLMHNRLYRFLTVSESLSDYQFGFRKRRSCEHALLVAQNELLSALSKKKIAMLLLIDFSKAFDMVDHEILLYKLQQYGIRGVANQWFRSYLEGREQYVSIDGHASVKRSLKYSVPQGSILGPLLFIIYINDLPNVNKFVKFILYADDANIIITGDTLAEIQDTFSELSPQIVRWVSQNQLLLNAKKTTYMIFSRKYNLELGNFTPTVNGNQIERKPVSCFLGLLLDDKLTWAQHIAAVKAKMSRYIGILYKLKQILPLKARLLTFNSLVQSHINYCCLVWGATNKSKLDIIFRTQKKAMRAVMAGSVNYFYNEGTCPTHTKSAFTKFSILTVHNIILKNMLLLMNKVQNFPRLLPVSVVNLIPPNAPNPSCTDNQIDYCSSWYQEFNSVPYNTSTFFKGPLLHYDILTNIPSLGCTNISTHNKKVKAYLMDFQNSGDPDEWTPGNFRLLNLPGMRSSQRAGRAVVSYAESD